MIMPVRLLWILLVLLASKVAWADDNTPPQEPGVTLRLYFIEPAVDQLVPLAENQTPNRDTLETTLDFGPQQFAMPTDDVPSKAKTMLVTAETDLLVKKAGEYAFELHANGPAELRISGDVRGRIDEANGEPETFKVPLQPGSHALSITYVTGEVPRGEEATPALRLRWQPPGADALAAIPAEALRTEANVTRVTSPGLKRLKDYRRPGDGKPVAGVHPSYDLATIHADDFEPRVGSMGFLPDGRLVVGLFNAPPMQRDEVSLPDITTKEPDKLWAFSNVNSDPADITAEVIADGLYEPLGLEVVDDAIYISQRKELTRLTDPDGDGYYDRHETVASGWDGWNYHQFTFGLARVGDRLYAALSTSMGPPRWEGMRDNSGPGGPLRGSLLEYDLNTGDTRYIAGGFRTPNGLGVGPNGELFVADNQGTWLPTSQFDHITRNHFYGHYNNPNYVPKMKQWLPEGGSPSMYGHRPVTPPALYLPQSELSNSPTESLVIETGSYAGQMLMGELTAGGIRRIFLDRVNGGLQGVAFRFSQGFEVGINRMAWGENGRLFVGGIGAGGNWNWKKTQSGLQRLTPNGKTVFEMHSVRALPGDSFMIEFTQPVDRDWLADAGNYRVQQWTYEPTQAYGGPKKNEQTLKVTEAVTSEDGRSVRVHVPGVEAGHVIHFRLDPTSESGERIWSTEAWYSLIREPIAGQPDRVSLAGESYDAGPVGVGAPAPAEAVTLIGSGALTGWNRGDDPVEPRQRSQDDMIELDGIAEVPPGQGDLVTRTVAGDARYHIEWLSPPGGGGQLAGNSGVFPQNRYELQVLNTAPGKTPQKNTAGAIYGVKAADVNASAGAGEWQSYDLWFRAPRFDEAGNKTEPARMTVLWNGVLIHDDVAIESPTSPAAPEEMAGPDGVQVGPLRLQAHATAAEGPVQYRNVWVAPLDVDTRLSINAGEVEWGEWQPLFDGESLDGWTPIGGKATFAVENGVIVGTTAPNTPNTFLTTTRDYGDFELELEVKVDADLNSGIQVRSTTKDNSRDRGARVTGYQVEVDQQRDREWSGGIYDEAGRAWLYPLSANPAAREAFRPGEWNRYRIVAVGPVLRTYVNDVPAAEIYDAKRLSGLIGLQVHGVGDRTGPLQVRWRNVRLREPVSE